MYWEKEKETYLRNTKNCQNHGRSFLFELHCGVVAET